MTRTHVPRKVTRCTKLRGAQRSPELALRSTDFRTPENLIFPALSYYFGRCLSELVQLVLRPYSLGESNIYCNGLYNFFCHHSSMLQECLCQQFLSLHS